jgi:hypothetical protein
MTNRPRSRSRAAGVDGSSVFTRCILARDADAARCLRP